jgi:hypothetical protein
MPDYEAVKYKCVTVKEDLKGKIKTKWHMKTDEQLYLKSTD